MIYERATSKTFEQVDQGLRDSAAKHKFGVIAVHDLAQTMRNKGVEFDGQCWVYEVCQPRQAKRVLEANGVVSTALPCRISVYRKGDELRIATIKPTALMGMLGDASLEPVAREVEDVVVAMIDESS